MATGDLTTLADVKTYLEITGSSDDPTLTRLVRQCSRSILDYLQRPSLVSQAYTERRGGRGNKSFYLPNWPVTTVSQVVVDGIIIPPATLLNGTPVCGRSWILDEWDGCSAGGPQAVSLIDVRADWASNNVLIDYVAGYLVSAEPWVIPAGGAPPTVTVLADLGPWSADGGVTGPAGAFTAVSGAPAHGQYSVAAGVYTFNAADVGTDVAISYSYTPHTLEDACINWIAERYMKRKRIGVKSKAIGDGQTESYDTSGIPSYITSQIAQYRKLLPL